MLHMPNLMTFLVCLLALLVYSSASAQTWTADNGNGTFSNPLFYDEFSDPDLIRVGDDYYLTGTTMHAMPGLPVLHSKDLVNWKLLGYAFDRLDLGPEFRLGRREGSIWPGHLGAELSLSQRHFLHLLQCQPAPHAACSAPRTPPAPGRARRSSAPSTISLFCSTRTARCTSSGAIREINFAQLNDELTDIVPGTGAHDHSERGRHGRGLSLLQDRGQILHHQRVVCRPHAYALRACRQTGWPV